MDDLVVNARLTIPAAELRATASRASGPGGQHVNKTETKVELRWSVTTTQALSQSDRDRLTARLAGRLSAAGDLIVTCADSRSRSRNTDIARRRLAALVRTAMIRPKRRLRTRPTRGAIERRLERKRHLRAKKRDRRWRHD